MSSTMPSSSLTLKDIAREAGVSLATVDRVLHERPGVRPETVRRVRETIDRHGFRPLVAAADLARGRAHRFAFVMPTGSNLFMQLIHAQIAELTSWMAARRASVEILTTDVLNPVALANTLESLDGRYDGIAVIALDHPTVRAAIDDLVETGMHVVTLVSDVPASRRHHYVGIDNIAAGRTAGTLVGRLIGPRSGKVAVVAGSQALRDHAERLFGFQQVLAAEYPHLEILPTVEGRDDDDLSEQVTGKILALHSDIIGIYNIGAGTPGVAKALIDAGRDQSTVFIGHDLTSFSRKFLLRGVMDAVISQDPGHETRSAIRVLMGLARQEPILAEQEKVRIEIILRDNLP